MEINQQTTNQKLAPQTTEKKRPMLVTILCILGFIGLALSLMGVFILLFMRDIPEIEAFRELPSWYPFFAMAIDIFYLGALVYIWKMKKVGLIAISGLFTANLVIAIAVAPSLALGSALVTTIVYAVMIGLFWTQYKKMS
ncbi:MAG: hypothetical protein Q8N28_00115 [bacterium]|nr:hypothetical protein [bacterium]